MSRRAEWREYEEQIAALIRERAHGDVRIETDVRLPGRSGVGRQIDILVEGEFAGVAATRMVVDCKCWSSKVDVADVDAFLGLVDDVDASFGLLVTTEGFSEAAERRTWRVATQVVPLVDIGLFDDASTWWQFSAGYPGRYVGDYRDIDVYAGGPALVSAVEFHTGTPGSGDWDVETIWATDDEGWDGVGGARVLATVLARHRLARNPSAAEVGALEQALRARLKPGQGFDLRHDEIDRWLWDAA